MINELIVRWNGINISKCDRLTMSSCGHWTFTLKVDLGTSPLAMCHHKCTKFL